MKEFSSERVINRELEVNNCGTQPLFDRDYHTVRVRKDFSVMYISKGRAEMVIGGKRVEVKTGEALFYRPDTLQDFYFKGADKSVNKWVHFSGTLCEKIKAPDAAVLHFRSGNEFESNLDRLVNAYYILDAERELLCDGYMRTLLALIIRSFSSDRKAGRIEAKMQNMLNDIHTHLNVMPDFNRLAADCFLSRDRFNHIFKSYTGLPPTAYVLNMRVERAKQYLGDTGMKVSECAEALGFSDTNYFCRVFKKHTGKTPEQYRRS